MGRVEGLGFLLLSPAEQRGHPDRLHRFDVVGRRGWRRDVDDALPHAVEALEELNFFGAREAPCNFHETLAAGADEGIFPPNAEDEIAPEWAEIAGARRGGSGDGGRLIGSGIAVPGLDFHAPALVGVAPVVADGVLVLGRDVLDCGGEETGGGPPTRPAAWLPAGAFCPKFIFGPRVFSAVQQSQAPAKAAEARCIFLGILRGRQWGSAAVASTSANPFGASFMADES